MAQGYAAAAGGSTGAQSLADITLSQGYAAEAQQNSAEQALYNATSTAKYYASLAPNPGPTAMFSAPAVNSNSEPISWNTSDFTGMTGLASLSQSVNASSSPSLTTSSPNAQKVNVTVIAANPGARATSQALVSSIRQMGYKI
jgi:hypothetical protein